MLIVAGLVVRLAGLPGPGEFVDLLLVSSWGNIVHFYGWVEGYRHHMYGLSASNYPPVNMAFFGAMMKINGVLTDNFSLGNPVMNAMMKLPAVLADAWLSLFLYAVLRRFVSMKKAVIAGLVCWLYPSFWMLSSYWGQTDSLYTSMSFGALVAFVFGLPFFGGFLLALSILTKVQGVILAPVMAVLLWDRKQYILAAAAGAVIPLVVVLAPFGFAGRLPDVAWIYTEIPGLPEFLSFFTYNFWWAIFGLGAPHIPDTNSLMYGVTFRSIGYALTSLSFSAILWRLWTVLRTRPDEKRRAEAALAAASLCSLAFFMFMTRMHQRYFFPFVPCAVVLCFLQPVGRRHIAVLFTTFCLNLAVMMWFWRLGTAVYGAFGIVLAWINMLVIADLAAVWWKTVLNPWHVKKKRS